MHGNVEVREPESVYRMCTYELRIGSESVPPTIRLLGAFADRRTVFRDRLAMETWHLGIAIKFWSVAPPGPGRAPGKFKPQSSNFAPPRLPLIESCGAIFASLRMRIASPSCRARE